MAFVYGLHAAPHCLCAPVPGVCGKVWGVRRGQPLAWPPKPICLHASEDTCPKHVLSFQDICFGSKLR